METVSVPVLCFEVTSFGRRKVIPARGRFGFQTRDLGNSRFDMTTEYERQRLLNISKNKELLDDLALARPKEDGRFAATPSSRPTKRQKLEPLPATRVSARLSTQPKPSYTEDNTPLTTVAGSGGTAKAPAPRKPSALSEKEVQEMIQGWTWEATAPLPTRSENGTLHFPDHLDVTSPFLLFRN